MRSTFCDSLLIVTILVATSIISCSGFSIYSRGSVTSGRNVIHSSVFGREGNNVKSFILFTSARSSKKQNQSVSTPTTLYASSSSFTNPTQEQSVELGIREWPQQTKTQSNWEEEVKDGETSIRYILQGSGDLTIDGEKPKNFSTGMLIEINGPASLSWTKKGKDDVIILTPGYEQGGLLAGAALTLITLCGVLIAGVGS